MSVCVCVCVCVCGVCECEAPPPLQEFRRCSALRRFSLIRSESRSCCRSVGVSASVLGEGAESRVCSAGI